MAEELSQLQRGATSLTLMLMGYDHDLDSHLKDLRKVLHNKDFQVDQFHEAMDEVERVYDNLEKERGSSIQSFARTFQSLISESAVHMLEPLQREQPLLADLLNLAEPLAKQISVLADADAADSDSDDPHQNIRSRLGSRFKALLQTLILMGDPDSTLRDLIQLLDETPSWDLLETLANKTIELLQNRLRAEKKQFEGYLAELSAKLLRINQIVESDSKTLSELKKINVDFNASISTQMNEARQKIDEQDTLDVLKTDLLSSLDSITRRLEQYQAQYESKLSSLQSNKLEMNNHIQELEQENLSLLVELEKERKLSMIDALTQLPNRQGFNFRMNEETSRANRYQQPISIAILDIDFFKKINDKFGHLVGDKVLRMIAKEMKRVSRGSDFLARFGGEEFVMIMPQTGLEEAHVAVEKIRAHVEECPFHYQNKPVPLTISAGVAERLTDENTEHWLNRSDEALYKSKNTGRNKVTSAKTS